MRILLLNTQMEPAGAQKALLELARGLKARGHTVTVVTMYDKANCISDFEQQFDMEIVNLEMIRQGKHKVWRNMARCLRGMRHLYRLLKARKIEVLQTFTHYSNILGPPVGWLARVPVRVSSQRNDLRGYGSWLLLLDRLIANSPLVQQMTVVSEGTRRFSITVERIRPSKLRTIYNGIDVTPYVQSTTFDKSRTDLGIPPQAVVITTIARLHVQKGHRHWLEAIPLVLEEIPAAHMLFVGEGPLRSEIEKQVEDLGLGECVHLLGVRRDVPELLGGSDLLVLPSLWEGLPNVVLEAMAASIPVVATNVSGCPEMVVPGETGLLVPPADNEALAEAVVRILSDEEILARMGRTARQRVIEQFSLETSIDRYEELYVDLLGCGSNRQRDGCYEPTAQY